MQTLVFAAVTLLSWHVMASEAVQTEQQPLPNIVLIFIDDMGYADIGPFGGEIPTPHLDLLAKEGRCFTNFCVSSGVCSASRSALMTGCYHRRVGIEGALPPASPIGLDPSEETLAEICKQKGYATACFGKWHLGRPEIFLPTNQGFDEYFGLPYSNDMWPHHPEYHNFPALPLLEGTSIEGTRVVNPDVDDATQNQLTTLYTEQAVRFIEKNRERPFFLYMPHTMVHVPLHVSDKFAGKSPQGLFGDAVMEIDWSVGQILDTLRKNNLEKNTLVIFSSDNGPWLSYGDHAGSAKPLREGKLTSFEGGVREPTIFRFPGKIPAGTRCGELASTIDILPTVARLIGAKLPERKIDGKDIRPLMFGEPGAKSPHDAFAIYFNGQLQAVRDTKWKLVLPHDYPTLGGHPGGKNGIPVPYQNAHTELALYDLDSDVSETTDVREKHPDITARLQKAADEIQAELGSGNHFGPGVRLPRRAEPVTNNK
ncbi:MAG: sulfatase [Planctomycetaceae bacterium]|nr:sulfatase [Planctomycetaceae bacterium]